MNQEIPLFPSYKKIGWRKYFQIGTAGLLLFALYQLGLPWPTIALMGLLFLLLILLKGKLYKKFDHFLNQKFPFLSRLNPQIKEVIIIVAFVLTFMLIKQLILAGLKMYGVDVQQTITDSLKNQPQ